MFVVSGNRSLPTCDGIHRRDLIRVGFLGMGGLSLSNLFAHRAHAGVVADSPKSVIFIELAGGPTQFETYDPKPNAPSEYRGPLAAINTNVAGVQFSQMMSEQAKIMDKLAIIRSIHHQRSSHDPSSHLTQTGYYKNGQKGGVNEMPCIGSVAAKYRGANAIGIPAYVAVPHPMRNGGAAYLGNACAPFDVGSDPNRKNFQVRNVGLGRGLTMDRLENRRHLIHQIDQQRRIYDHQGDAEAIDKFSRQAFDLVSGNRARVAFDIGQESDRTRDRFGRTSVGQSLLLARRLVEAGVTFVSVRAGGWDNHNKIENALKRMAPAYDRGIAALIGDIFERGLDRDVLVVSMGEFGRTPRVNKNAGRDHWGAVMSVLMAGGGLKPGTVVGSSDAKGAIPNEKPYRPENVLSMIYRHLEIDPSITVDDFAGRPRYILEQRELIHELL